MNANIQELHSYTAKNNTSVVITCCNLSKDCIYTVKAVNNFGFEKLKHMTTQERM